MDTLNNLIKAILSFVSDENETLCQHIHAGYQSCVRECERRVDKRDDFVEESFSSCELFSLALDTALFGQEHILSCVARFVFEDKITLFPLFFNVCHASTGEEMQYFVFHKLERMRAPFEKLSAVTTDGANEMVGKQNGMVCHLLNRIRRETGNQTCVFQTSGVCHIV